MNTDIKTYFHHYVKLLFFAAVVVVTLIFYVSVKHHYEFPKTMAARFLMIPAVVMFFVVFWNRLWNTSNPLRLPFLLLLTAASLSALKSVNLSETLDPKYLIDIFLFALMAHYLVAARFSLKDVHFFGLLLVFAGLLTALYGIVQFYRIEDVVLKGPLKALAVKAEGPVSPVSFQGNINYAAEVHNFVLPLTVVLALASRTWAGRIFFVACFILVRYHLIIVNTRATEVGLAVSTPVILLVLFWLRRKQWPRLVFLIICFWFLFDVMTLVARNRGSLDLPASVYLRSFATRFIAPMLIYVLYYVGIPSIIQFIQSKRAGGQPSLSDIASNLILDITQGQRSEYAQLQDETPETKREAHGMPLHDPKPGHDWQFTTVRKVQHCTLIVIAAIGIIAAGILGTQRITQSYHRYQIDEQLFRLRRPTYSSFFTEWLGPKTFAYRARHPDYVYQWYRDTVPEQEQWDVPGFDQYLKDSFDAKFFWDRSVTFRIEVYNSALRIIRDNVFFGIGIGSFKIIHDLYTSQLERFVLGKEVLGRKVHNEYLTYAAMHGAFGLLALFWIHFVILKLAYRIFRSNRSECIEQTQSRFGKYRSSLLLLLTIGLVWGLLINAFSMIFGHSLTMPASHFIYWAILGLVVSLYNHFYGIDQPQEGEELAAEDSAGLLSRAFGLPAAVWTKLCLSVLLALVFVTPFFFHWMGEYFMQSGMLLKKWHEELSRQVNLTQRQVGRRLKPSEERSLIANFYEAMRKASPLIAGERVPASLSEADSSMEDRVFYLFEESLDQWPFHMETYYILGRYCIDFNRFTRGIEILEQDLFMNPNYKWAHNNIGVCFDKVGEYVRARDVYYRALAIDPQQIFAHFNLAMGYMRQDTGDKPGVSQEGQEAHPLYVETPNYRWALHHLKGVIDSNPLRLDVYSKMAYCQLQLGMFEEAEETIQDYFYLKDHHLGQVEKAPTPQDDLQAYQVLLDVYRKQGKQGKLVDVYKELVDLVPHSPEVRRGYIAELVRADKHQEALQQTRALAYLTPRDPMVHIQLAEMILGSGGSVNEALRHYEKAVEHGGEAIRKRILSMPRAAELMNNPDFREIVGATEAVGTAPGE